MEGQLQRDLARVFRAEWGKVLASLVRSMRDFELAEDALQEAIVEAATAWSRPGAWPAEPAGWLYRVARRRMIDHVRRRENFRRKEPEIVSTILGDGAASTTGHEHEDHLPDERLRLIFTCCHPALAVEARIALTLHTLGGLKTPAIARAFLVPEATVAQRLVRAKRKIKLAGIPYEVPSREQWPERLGAVLTTLYLIFNEGYLASDGGELLRVALCEEAIRLARVVVQLAPHDAETKGLLALLVLHHSRAAARTDAAGHLITLEDQDRSRWDRTLIDEGTMILDDALAEKAPGPYQLQAAISALHAAAPDYASTDWPQICFLYQRLHHLSPSPVVELNALVALSYAEGPETALPGLRRLEHDGALANYLPLQAALADCYRRSGAREAARIAYQRARDRAENDVQRAFFQRRLAALEG